MSVLTFFVPNTRQLLTLMIGPAHVDHFTNALHKYWLSHSKDVTNAVS